MNFQAYSETRPRPLQKEDGARGDIKLSADSRLDRTVFQIGLASAATCSERLEHDRPELFKNVASCNDAHVDAESLKRLSRGALGVWQVSVCQTRGAQSAEKPGPVRGFSAAVSAG